MSPCPLRVVIVGAGLAGLCLAQGLTRTGAEVSVFERDEAVASRGQGYRIHVAPEGTRALRACLPPQLWDLALKTSGKLSQRPSVTVLDGRLEEVHRVEFPAIEDGSAGITVDRLMLRQILMAGLEDRVHFGAPFDHFERAENDVHVHFGNGEAIRADLLVAADGASSRVRPQLLPQAKVLETGTATIYGKTPLSDEVRALLPPAALDGFSTVVGPEGRFLPLAAIEFRTDPASAAAAHWPGLEFADTREYAMWVMGAPAASLGVPTADLFRLQGPGLIEIAARLADWHPSLPQIICLADPATVTPGVMREAQPLDHWQTCRVTLVGDAIHCMIPAGIGAAVALQDAGLLSDRLAEAIRGEKPTLEAVAEYEREMLKYGFEAVAASKQVAEGHAP